MRTGEPRRYLAIDGLRGLAALYVVIFHVSWQSPIVAARFTANGYLGVDLFFIISGFVIASVYWDRVDGAAELKRFVLLRFFRLYPLHAAVLGVLVAIELVRLAVYRQTGAYFGALPFTDQKSLAHLLSHIFLLQGLGLTDGFGWNAPSWSISCEFIAYLLFGAAAIVLPLERVRAPMLIGAAAALYAFVLARDGGLHSLPLARCLAGFVLGNGLWRLVTAPGWRRAAAGFSPRLRGAAEIGIFAATLAALALVSGFGAAVIIPLFAVAVLLLQADEGPIARALASGPMQHLGRLSYSIYMVHLLALMPFTLALKVLGSGGVIRLPDERIILATHPIVGAVLMLLAIGLVLAISHVTYTRIEEPGRRFGRRLSTHLPLTPPLRSAPVA
jgi:peptidoglycan/LPS O-acetylase OafA/YrhL